jgi:hypothetical protein
MEGWGPTMPPQLETNTAFHLQFQYQAQNDILQHVQTSTTDWKSAAWCSAVIYEYFF